MKVNNYYVEFNSNHLFNMYIFIANSYDNSHCQSTPLQLCFWNNVNACIVKYIF